MRTTLQRGICFCSFAGFAMLMGDCSKPGQGGDAEVSVHVAHHGKPIPGAMVHVKYGAKEFPGNDPSLYDLVVQTGTSDHANGHAHVQNLKHGDYYFYATGFDSSIAQRVSGGLGVRISRKERKEKLSVDVPVTE